ncbi:hypothetical protein G7K_5710-t1 [Saitoella complicata NRRL Y-17804]|uniref:Uncharacterized protein n=1 Tax=Saitoella complicata (strain BCRC 22490 / CBS 7301 / JCM 7358 / NBRC 10748 / NRRL Y-17804) TaxID=698492 RepID=A0A0E9NP51_SAICN|nr:hypothetical protein G7K_5710-t1 [Saitoella complicata NRRL Y-17804]
MDRLLRIAEIGCRRCLLLKIATTSEREGVKGSVQMPWIALPDLLPLLPQPYKRGSHGSANESSPLLDTRGSPLVTHSSKTSKLAQRQTYQQYEQITTVLTRRYRSARSGKPGYEALGKQYRTMTSYQLQFTTSTFGSVLSMFGYGESERSW